MLLLQFAAAALLCGRLTVGALVAPQEQLPPPFANKGRLSYAKPKPSPCCRGPQSPFTLNIDQYSLEEDYPVEVAEDERPFPIPGVPSPPGAPEPDNRTVYEYLKETGE